MKKGLFIDFEGGEKVGKTTQIRRLKKYLEDKGFSVTVSQEPGGGDQNIRQKLLGRKNSLTAEEELDLFCEDRRLHVKNLILPAIQEGKIVILDRFEPSSVAYQGYGRGLPVELIRQKSEMARQGLEPDIIILLDADPIEAHKREEATTRFDLESLEFHRRVRDGFIAQAHEKPSQWRVIDASLPIGEVEVEVRKCIDDIIKKHSADPK